MKVTKKHSYSESYRYLSPRALPVPILTPPSHPLKAAQEACFRASLGKTLNGVGPVQTSVERATEAITLVQSPPSRQALTGLPGTSHDRFLPGGSIADGAVAFMEGFRRLGGFQ